MHNLRGDRGQQLTLGHLYFFPQDRTVESEEKISSNLTQKENKDTVNFSCTLKIILICMLCILFLLCHSLVNSNDTDMYLSRKHIQSR